MNRTTPPDCQDHLRAVVDRQRALDGLSRVEAVRQCLLAHELGVDPSWDLSDAGLRWAVLALLEVGADNLRQGLGVA